MYRSPLTLSLIAGLFTVSCNATAPNNNDAVFLSQLQPHCGKAYSGQIISQDEADNTWRKEAIKMHVRDCTDGEVKIALHVGENRSRTWILRYEDITNKGKTLALRHDHRHEDGSPDAVTFYGGYTASISSEDSHVNGATTKAVYRAIFPADQSTKDLFDRENIPVSKDNIWAMQISDSSQTFTYEMARPNRDFRIEFDTSAPIETPPTPWGWE